MITLKQKLIIALLLTVANSCVVLFAQDKVSLAVFQDARFLVAGDNRGNDAGTINLLARFKMQGNQQAFGYMVIFPEYEYANLAGGKYVRYSANIGYTFNKLVISNLEANASGGFGYIDRFGTSHSLSASAELAYKLSNRFKISILSQYTRRTDLQTPVWRFSGFVGIELTLN